MDWLGVQLQSRYGKHGAVKMQSGDFLHIGHHYVEHGDGSMSTDLRHFIAQIEEPKVPSNLSAILDDEGIAAVQSVAGNLTYASPERPDKCGEIAMVQQSLAVTASGEPPTNAVLKEAVRVLREMKATNTLQIWYPLLQNKELRLTIPGDSALRNVDSKYSQQGYMALLEDASTEVGGLSHLLDHSTRRSGRVAPSSLKAEILIAAHISELGQKLVKWLDEIWFGAETARELRNRQASVRVRLWTDCYDLFSALGCPRAYAGRDPSLHLFVEGLKEDMRTGLVDEYGWCPTEHMLPDSMTKRMRDRLITAYLQTGRWKPEGYELLTREKMPVPLGSARARASAAVASESSSSSSSNSVPNFPATAASESAAPSTFWTCRPGCSNCVNAVAEELYLASEFPLDGAQAGKNSVFFTVEETKMGDGSAGPSLAQVALARTYLALLTRP